MLKVFKFLMKTWSSHSEAESNWKALLLSRKVVYRALASRPQAEQASSLGFSQRILPRIV